MAAPPACGLGGTVLLLHGADALGEGVFLPGRAWGGHIFLQQKEEGSIGKVPQLSKLLTSLS